MLDTPTNPNHSAFGGRVDYYPWEAGSNINWGINAHGTAVSGVIIANSSELKGIAYNGKIYAGGMYSDGENFSSKPEFIKAYLDAAEARGVRIFNNSWGSPSGSIDKDASIIDFTTKGYNSLDIANRKNSVFVFAAGNEGNKLPSPNALTPRFLGAGEAANFISVGSLDSSGITKAKDDDKIHIESNGVSSFSNLAFGAELWTIFAPGSNIHTTNSNNGYSIASGTSFAAPMVSGALALVAEKYPWLNGKQLADAILTTANNDFSHQNEIKLSYIDENGEMQSRKYEIVSEDEVKNKCQNNPNDCQYITKEQAFGRGILDVGKAVNGIALLDANRMTAKDKHTIAELQGTTEQLLETFDTKGWTSEFSNDISSRNWDNKYHHADNIKKEDSIVKGQDTKIGILKKGDGTLILSGDNSYTGATVIEGGGIHIGSKIVDNKVVQGVIRGSGIVVRNDGVLSGSGIAKTKVVMSGGTLQSNSKNEILTMGEISGSGNLYINLTNGGKIIVDKKLDTNYNGVNGVTLGDSDISKLNLELTYAIDSFVRGNESIKSEQFLDNQNNSIDTTQKFANDGDIKAISSVTLDVSTKIDYNDFTATFSTTRQKNAYKKHADSKIAEILGENLYQIAENSDRILNDMKMQNTFIMLDSQTNASVVKDALSKIANGTEVFSAGIASSLNLQNSLNSTILWQLSHKNFYKNSYDVWVTPLGGYHAFSKGDDFSGYKGYNYGALLGFDALWGESSLGLHLGFVQNDEKTSYANTQSLGFYAGIQGKITLDWAYILGAVRFGAESADYKQYILDRTSINSATNLIFNGNLGVGADFNIGNVNFGPLALADFSYLKRGKFSNNGDISFLVPQGSEKFDAISLIVGGKVGYTWDNTLKLEMLGAYRREFGKIGISGNTSFDGYANLQEMAYKHTIRNRDVFSLQLDFSGEFDDGIFSNVAFGGDFGKNYMGFSGSVQIGYRFGGEAKQNIAENKAAVIDKKPKSDERGITRTKKSKNYTLTKTKNEDSTQNTQN